LGIFYFSTGKYRDHAIGILKAQLDNQLLSEIQINKDDIHLSLCKNFPYISLELSHILVKSAPVADLESFKRIDADTLLYAKRINLSFNIRSLFSKKYELKKIEIEDASLNLLSDRRGNVNYKIIKDTEKDTLQDSIRFDIKKIILRNIEFQYSDLKSNFFYSDLISRGEVNRYIQ
jgi:AsmA protein